MAFSIQKYDDSQEERWDNFVLRESMNGTFLQTRKFINYHAKGKFSDSSLMIYKGNNLVAVILACIYSTDNLIYFHSHRGTTFGGIIISKNIYSTTAMNEIMELFEENMKQLGCTACYIKQTPSIFQKSNTDLLDYFFFQKGYQEYTELNFYLDLDDYRDDILKQFSSSKRRDYRYSLRNQLVFKELSQDSEIREFYDVLQLNLEKLGLNSVHSYEDLIDLKMNRFNENIKFYGVYHDAKMIAGSMIFIFNGNIFHTQYLSSDQEYLDFYPMDFLIYNLIKTALEQEMKLFTFGICTENQGKYLNLGLARFKEGFGIKYSLNKSFEKIF